MMTPSGNFKATAPPSDTVGEEGLADVPGVLLAFEAQVGCYRALAKLAERQHSYVQNEQTEELIALLSERQAILDRLSAASKAVGPARQAWGAFTAGLSGADRVRVEGMLAETKRLLAEITAGDERDALTLQQRKHQIGTEIKANASARVVNRSYAANAYARPKFSNVDEVR